MQSFSCERCGAPMAVAELQCSNCGLKAPQGRAAALLLSKAEMAFDAGRLTEAAGLLERAFDDGAPEASQAAGWRKLALWQQKAVAAGGPPDLEAKASKALARAIELDDRDPLSHQLYIAHYARLGRLDQAAAYYKARAEANPDDLQAARQLQVIRLSGDFLASPPKVTLNLPPPSKLERLLRPTPVKTATVGLNLLAAVAGLAYSLVHDAPAPGPVSDDVMPGMDQLIASLNSPWTWGFQGAISALLLWFMFRNRR